MAITLPDPTAATLVASIQRYFQKERDEEIGSLQAGFFLDFVLAEIGPSVYNLGVRDAQAALQNAVADLDAMLHEPEFGHSTARRAASRPRPHNR